MPCGARATAEVGRRRDQHRVPRARRRASRRSPSAQLDTGLDRRSTATRCSPHAHAPPRATSWRSPPPRELRDAAMTWRGAARTSGDPHSPWHAADAWWLNGGAHAIRSRSLTGDARRRALCSRGRRKALAIVVVVATVQSCDRAAPARAAARPMVLTSMACASPRASPLADERYVFCARTARRLRSSIRWRTPARTSRDGGHLMAPMSGTIVAVLVKRRRQGREGAPLLIVLEAMKMEHTIAAPAAGHRERRFTSPAGDQVRRRARTWSTSMTPRQSRRRMASMRRGLYAPARHWRRRGSAAVAARAARG